MKIAIKLIPLFLTSSFLVAQPQLTIDVIDEYTRPAAGRPETTTVDLYDEYDAGINTMAMARTTGYICATVARPMLDGRLPGARHCAVRDYWGESEGLLTGF